MHRRQIDLPSVVAVIQCRCVCPLITGIAALVNARMWPRSRFRNNDLPPDNIAFIVVVTVIASAVAAAAALSSLRPLHPIASFTL